MKKSTSIRSGILTVLILAAFSFNTFAAIMTKGNNKSEERSVSSFNAIELKCSADLYLYQGKSHKVVVEIDDRYMDQVETYVRDNVLIIDTEGNMRNISVFKVYVTCVELESLEVAGSGDVYAEDMITCDDFMLLINGSGNAEMQISADELKCKVNGSGDVELEGEADQLYIGINGSGDMVLDFMETDECLIKLTGSGDVKISGSTEDLTIKQVSSGDVSAFSFKTEECTIDKSGSGDTRVYVTGELAVTASGSGDVYYKGSPDITYISVTGSGDVRSVD